MKKFLLREGSLILLGATIVLLSSCEKKADDPMLTARDMLIETDWTMLQAEKRSSASESWSMRPLVPCEESGVEWDFQTDSSGVKSGCGNPQPFAYSIYGSGTQLLLNGKTYTIAVNKGLLALTSSTEKLLFYKKT